MIMRPIKTEREQNTASGTAATQPTYEFFTGSSASSPPPLAQQSFRQSQTVKPDIGNEDLRAQIKRLQYELESFKQERDLTTIRHEKELRDAQVKAKIDFSRAQVSESTKHVATHKYEALQREFKALQDESVNRQHDLEKRLRNAQEQTRALKDDLEEARAELTTLKRQQIHQLQEIENKYLALQSTLDDTRVDVASKTATLQVTQERLLQRESAMGKLESEVIELRALTDHAGELQAIRNELTGQVTHTRTLEKTNRDQTAELRHLRQVHKAVEIVEEEKRVLENKVKHIDDLQRELVELQFQRQRLEDERKSWAAYLSIAGSDRSAEYDSPEAMARALAQARSEIASLTSRLGAIQPEVSEKEAIIRGLEAERIKIYVEMERVKTGGGDNRAKARLERQKALAMKEVEYLREQLRTFDSEDAADEVATSPDELARGRIGELEKLLSQYKHELQILHDDLFRMEENISKPDPRLLKRPHEEETDERFGEMSRKNRRLQSDLASLQQAHELLTCELSATKAHLSAAEQTSSTRILSLRSNPTDDFQNLKLSTIASLSEENKALLAQLEGQPHGTKVVPISSLHNAKLKIGELEHSIQEKEKRMLRLRQVYAKTMLDFREAIASLLGWKMDPMSNGRFRLTSLYNPSNLSDEEEGGNSLIFNGDTGAFNTSGGPRSPFEMEIRPLIRFWVEERQWIPGFLAGELFPPLRIIFQPI
ncbi:coiled-coil domain-containing protein mad1 [Lambiella insularis]|nr:coiled-coil domain-containing protein mad1 [Lambiella insularis]